MPRSDQEEPTPHPDGLIAVGVIRKAHGVRGEASSESLSHSLDRFSELERVYLVSPERDVIKRFTVTGVRFHGDRALLRFEQITSPEALREYQNWTIEVPENEARSLDQDEYFLHELTGMTLATADGTELGSVVDISESSGGLLLEVERPNGRRFDVPFVSAFCTKIDRDTKKITVDLPEGLVDLGQMSPASDVTAPSDVARLRVARPPSAASGGGDAITEIQPPPGTTEGGRATAETAADELVPRDAVITFDLVTIFPDMFAPLLSEGVLARAIRRNIVTVRAWDLRDYAKDKHRSTDDEAYGGGSGMVMLAEPVFLCLEAIAKERGSRPHVVLMSPQGRPFDQARAEELSRHAHLVLLCGRYEGFDQRISGLVDEEISVGDFVVTGGELPAMLVVDAVSRMIDGVVGQRNSVEADSFYNGLLDYPHYTRPAELRGMPVPEVLLSGHFENIRKWRLEQSLRNTLEKRPDLLEKRELDEEAKRLLGRLRGEVVEAPKRKKSLNKTEK